MAKVKRFLGIIVILALVISVSALFFASFVFLPTQADEPPKKEKIEELQQWVYEQGYNYTVAENWITRLSPEEREALCGSRSVQAPDGPLPENMGFFSDVPALGTERVGQPPSSYDAMALGYVTPVKDQAGCGACWIFGATADFESDVAIAESTLLDFAEQEVGDCNIYYSVGGYNWCLGGIALMTTNFFTKKGLADETCYLYAAAPGTCQGCPLLRNVDNWKMITGDDGESQITAIKNAILNYGPVYASMYASDEGFVNYNSGVYEYWGTEDIDHAIQIIGWDDTKTHSGPIQGAWMIKNSWGTDWGAGHTYPGCAWVAYGSANLGDWTSAISDYGSPPLEMFYHDEGGWMFWGYGTGTTATAWGAVRFTPSQNETLTAVDFWTDDINMSYEIRIFDTLNDLGGGNYSFSSQLGTTQPGTTDEMGYYSILLSTPVPLTSGDDFIVQVKLTSGTSDWYYPIPIDYYDAATFPWLPPWSSIAAFSGESYYSSDGATFIKPTEDIGIRARGEDTTPPTMEPIAESPGQYYNTAPSFSNFGFDDNVALDDGWYQIDSFSGTWEVLFSDVSGTSWDDNGWPIPGFDALAEGSHTIYFKASDEASNVEGESGEWSWQFFKDTTPPTDPTGVTSTSHTLSVWSTDNTIDITWTDATDATSGLDGYSILWDTTSDTLPPATLNLEDSIETATSAPLADGDSHYFHIRAVDNAGNWQSTVHLGPFFIDTTPPTDPTDVTSDPAVSTWSNDDTVEVNWTASADTGSGLDGYSIEWDTTADTLPDDTIDIQEGITSDTSPALADGNSHYFHIRSVDNVGNWQSTVHVGPFFIDKTAPADPTGVTSDPAVSTWSNDDTVEVNWAASADTGSGLDGYSIEWDTTADTLPDDTIDIQEGITSDTSAALGEGDSHYFHIRAVDELGNWQSTIHVGPFFIDTTPPAAVTDLATSNPTRTSISLSWTAPGDDTSGTATYDIRYSTFNITAANWDSATPCTGEPTPSAAGNTETFTVTGLSNLTTYYFALKTADKVPNWSALSNVASGTTQNSLPVLSNGTVSPTSGYTSTTFTYSVTYTDAENDAPNSPTVSIDGGLPKDMTAQDPGDEDYTDGKVYEYSIVGSDLGTGSHTFQFAASDGIDDATGDIDSHSGPTVSSPPSGGGGGGGGGGGDTSAPVISNIECSDCTKTSIIIKWRTDEISTSQVEYWASEHMFSPLDESLVLYHEVTLTNLKSCCVYHFRTISKDNSDNEAISEEDTFTTLGTPAAFTISTLVISPTEVDVGEDVTVSVVVDNTGDAKGTYEVTLKTDEAVVATEEVTLAGGDSKKVTFTTSKDVAGTYDVGINGLTGTFVVKAPAAFTISTLVISPAEVDIGEDITIRALVTNTGDLTGTYEVTLKIDGAVVATKEVTLAGGASEEVTFTVAEDVAGTYTVNLDGLLGIFTVKAGTNWWLIGGIIAAVVAAGSVIYFFFVRRRRKA